MENRLRELTKIIVTDHKNIEYAESLAEHLGLQIEYEDDNYSSVKIKKSGRNHEEDSSELHLRLDQNGLALIGDGLVLYGDFTRMIPRLKPNNLNGEILVKAAKQKDLGDKPLAVDCTAGLGEDSLLLAAAGYQVKMFEYNPIIAALLQDALQRATKVPELGAIVKRMHLTEGDSIVRLGKLAKEPDLILLDPMFPERQKSGLVKKKFQLLGHLELPCSDETELFQAAVNAHPRKIVIKRPAKGPYLANVKPSYSLESGGIRYDCHIYR